LPTGQVTGLTEREIAYPARAREIAQNLPGSSAGGEQPKFLTTLQTEAGDFQPVLVKFSAPMDQPTGQRWADLLLCEFHAHEVLADAGLSGPGCEVLDFENRRFLQIPRFDRNGPGGRRGVVSLEALAAALGIEIFRGWDKAAAALLQRELITTETVSTIRRLSAFGELIGNTDMHFGNLSFFLDDTLPFRITPSYDMLPMLWAPGPQGELTERIFAPSPPLPATLEHWREAAGWAENFWERVARDPLLSAGFAGEARMALEMVRRLRQHVG
jgi:serine/threonine protein kinase HipA of HipAB toxin-antitoxin module